MKRVLVAGALSGLLILGTPALAFSAERGGNSHDSRSGNSGHSDNRGSHADNRGDRDDHGRHDRGDYRGGYYRDGYYYGGPYYYGDPYYYGGYQECHRDPSGSVTCEPYGGDYDPGGYNGGYPDPPPDPQYCSHPHSAHSARCPGDEGSSGGGY